MYNNNKLNISFNYKKYGRNRSNGNQRIVTIPASEIIKKLRTKEDRQNICRENSMIIFIIIFRLVYTN